MNEHQSPERNYDLERLIFLSDGVFAIVITLLALELRVPAGWDRTFAGLLRDEWRQLMAFALSFFAVGAFWNSHRHLYRLIVRFHPGLVALNFVLLGAVVLLPYASTLIFDTGPRGEPFLIYLGVIAAIALAQAMLFTFAAYGPDLLDPQVTPQRRRMILTTLLAMPSLVALTGLLIGSGASMPLAIIPIVLVALTGRHRRRALRG